MNSQREHPRFRHNQILLTTLVVMALSGAQAAEMAPKPLFPGITPVCSSETLRSFLLPNTTIESAVIDTTNHMCLVTAIVTHPPAETA